MRMKRRSQSELAEGILHGEFWTIVLVEQLPDLRNIYKQRVLKQGQDTEIGWPTWGEVF